jgi:glucokinase
LVVVLSLGTGVGGGVIDHGRIIRGARGMAAEFGHMALTPAAGPRCACGQRGCLEAYVNAGAVVRVARQHLAADPGSVEPSFAAALRADTVSAHVVGEAARRGDPTAVAVFEEIGRHLGLGIANLVNAFDPDVVVIGGGVAMVGAPLLDAARRTAAACLMAPFASGLAVRAAELEDQGGVLGAALLALGAAEPASPAVDAASTAPPPGHGSVRPTEPG